MPEEDKEPISNITKPLYLVDNLKRAVVGVVVISVILGLGTGYIMANKSGATRISLIDSKPKAASQDNRTFRDFAEGTIKLKPQPSDPNQYSEGTHYLQKAGVDPVALTSSVVDLSQYEGKKVKVFGETQKAVKEGWLMDVGKIEEIK